MRAKQQAGINKRYFTKFAYNPFAGATIHFFPRDRETPRSFHLEPIMPHQQQTADGAREATACRGRVYVTRYPSGSIVVTVNGKTTERYSIVYGDQTNGNRRATRGSYKKIFAAY